MNYFRNLGFRKLYVSCIMLLNAFLNFVFYLVVNNNSWGRLFPSNIFKLILRELFLFHFQMRFSVLSVVYLLILHLSYCIQSFILFTELLLFVCSIVSFNCSRMYWFIALVFATVDFILPVKMISWIALESASKGFCLLKSAAINI